MLSCLNLPFSHPARRGGVQLCLPHRSGTALSLRPQPPLLASRVPNDSWPSLCASQINGRKGRKTTKVGLRPLPPPLQRAVGRRWKADCIPFPRFLPSILTAGPCCSMIQCAPGSRRGRTGFLSATYAAARALRRAVSGTLATVSCCIALLLYSHRIASHWQLAHPAPLQIEPFRAPADSPAWYSGWPGSAVARARVQAAGPRYGRPFTASGWLPRDPNH